MPAAKGRKVVQILAALAVLAAVALPAGASIPRPGQLPGLNPETLLAAAREAPAPQPTANPQDASFELFAEPIGDRFRLSLQAAADAPTEARFHLLTPPKTRVRGFRLPEPLVIGVELSPSRTAFRLYGDVPYGFASGGLYVTTDPLGYVDGPNLYQYALNNPVDFSDPMGLETFIVKYGPKQEDADVYVALRFIVNRQDPGLTEEAIAGFRSGFDSGVRRSWSALRPKIFIRMGYATEKKSWGRQVLEFDSASPFMSDIRLDSGPGRSNSKLFYLEDATEWTYAHEFGHLLGLRDYYQEELRRGNSGGWLREVFPDVERFGDRAHDSLMGTTTRDQPTQGDLEDILDPALSEYESRKYQGSIHHLDLTDEDLTGVIEFLEGVGAAREVDISTQLGLLREKGRNQKQRRILVNWAMRALFLRQPQ